MVTKGCLLTTGKYQTAQHFTLPSLSLTNSYIHTLWPISLQRTHCSRFQTSRPLYSTVQITVSIPLHKQYKTRQHTVCWRIMQRNVGWRTCVISGFCCEANEIWLWLLYWWPLEVGPKRSTETSETKYQCTLRNIPEERRYRDMCLAVGYLNVNYVEDPKRLKQIIDAAVAMIAK